MNRLMALVSCCLIAASSAFAEDTVLNVGEGLAVSNTTEALLADENRVSSLIKRGGGEWYQGYNVGGLDNGSSLTTAAEYKEIVVEEGTLVLACGDFNNARCRTLKITVKSGATCRLVHNKDRSTANRNASFQLYRMEPQLEVEEGGVFDFQRGGIEKVTKISGAGTLRNPSGTLTGPLAADFTGHVVFKSSSLGSNSMTFGTGSDATKDFDFTRGIDFELGIGHLTSGDIECGRFYFKNTDPVRVPYFPFTCTFPQKSALGGNQMALLYMYSDLAIDDCDLENVQVLVDGVGANLTFNGGRVKFQPKVNQADLVYNKAGSVTLNGGEFSDARRTTDRNYSIGCSRIKTNPGSYGANGGDGDLVINGGEHWFSGACAARTTFNGGRVWWGEFNGGAAITCIWNGAKFYGWGDGGTSFQIKIVHENSTGKLAMGARGGHYEIRAQRSTPTLLVRRPLYSGVEEGVDGGLTFIVPGVVQFQHPCEFTGPFRLASGELNFISDAAVCDSDHVLGYGDLELGNARVSTGRYGGTVPLAHSAGKVLRLVGAPIVFLPLPEKEATAFAVGPDNAADTALVRAAGGALFLGQDGAYDLDGTKSTFSVAGGVPVSATGLPKVPVFQMNTVKLGNNSYNVDFMRYDATKGFVKLESFTRENELGTEATDIVLLSGEKTTVSTTDAAAGALKVERDYSDYSTRTGVSLTDGQAQLYLEAGSRLTVGDGMNPAPVILNSYDDANCAAIKGEGTLDFGTGEGVFAVNGRRAIVAVTLAGSAGVTFVGTGSYPGVWLGRASAYKGPTYINAVSVAPEVNGAFGEGDIWIGEGMGRGGRLALKAEGLDIQNNLHMAGFGGGWEGGREKGAIYCSAPARISGDIELTGNSKIVVDAGGELTIAGAISGDWGLRVYNHAVNTTDDGGKDIAFARDSVGRAIFEGANTYAGITEVIRSTLVLRGPCSTGIDRTELDSGCLRFENDTDVTYANRVIGSGVIQLAGRGLVTFRDNLEGQEGELFTLDLAKKATFVSSLKGVGRITTSRRGVTHLSVLNDAEGSFAGEVPANVTLHYGKRYEEGLTVIVR